MALTITVNGDRLPQPMAGPFFAVRVGAGPGNDITLSETTPGVQRHHCTIVYSGSTYRLEMPPTHLVFVDGERGECGQQLFRNNPVRCVLSIGGAPPRGRSGLASPLQPPQIVLELDPAEARSRPQRRDFRGTEQNRDLSAFARVSVARLATAVGALAVAGAGFAAFSVWQDRTLRSQLESVARLTAPTPSPEIVRRTQAAVYQLGLAKEGRFVPSGTAWAWRAPSGKVSLVTNVHVVDAIEACAQSTTLEAQVKCAGVDGGCPAIRRFHAGAEIISRIAPCEQGREDAGDLKARRHPDFKNFALWARQGAAGPDFPNVYDVAVVEVPDSLSLEAEPLEIAEEVDSETSGVVPGGGVAIIGFPSEGGGRPDQQASSALFRPGWIGRVSDPFGLPSEEEDFIVIAGAEVVGGESGSPIINADGKVVAMTFAGYFGGGGGDPDSPRIAYGGRMKALRATLLLEVPEDGRQNGEQGVSSARLQAWRNGISRIGADYRQLRVSDFRRSACNAERVSPESPENERVRRLRVKTVHEDTFRTGGAGSISGWAYAGSLDLEGPPGARASVLMTVEARGDRPTQVLLSSKLGDNGARLASSDPNLTVATANVSASFSERAPSRRFSYVVFSPGESGRDAEFDIEIREILCVSGGVS